jgi:hypothetical protein
MQYQLKSGRVIYLSVEEYLSMSDQDLQDLEASNLGEYLPSPWAGSAIKKQDKPKEKQDIDKSIDFREDSDEVEPSIRIQSTAIAIITVDEIPSSNDEEASEEAEDI